MALGLLEMPPDEGYHGLSLMSGRSLRPGADARRKILALDVHRFVGLTDRSTIIYLDLMQDCIEATQLPLDRRRRAIEAIDARRRAASRGDSLLGNLTPPIATLDAINLRGIAHLRTAQVALAIQRYRLAASEIPDSLSDLVPTYLDEVPKDPFGGNELRYKKLDVGYVVYSIGEDLTDDGGKEKLPKSKRNRESPNYDVTFIVER
jgi:hypothetical protein